MADVTLNIVADILLHLWSGCDGGERLPRASSESATRGRCFAKFGCDRRQTNNAAGLK